jgi:NAD(P)-dependent dehydrogenase (short-subunit alcohol dehydrogenase family)
MPVVMVTGGASWFSRETARLLLQDNWRIVLSDVNADNLARTTAELGGGAAVSSGFLDVVDYAAVTSYVDRLVDDLGSIDALVNVAGGSNYLGRPRVPFHESDPEYWEAIVGPNLYGVMNCCRAALPHMVRARKGVIVNIASGMGLRGKPNMAPYSAAKAAVIGFSQSICQEVGQYGIRVNCVAPGSAESRWQPELRPQGARLPPLGARTSARDVANAVAFLISDRASHITGSCLDISGGSSLH